jgi:hypothetical protein
MDSDLNTIIVLASLMAVAVFAARLSYWLGARGLLHARRSGGEPLIGVALPASKMPGTPISPELLAETIASQVGEDFKASWMGDGAWDRNTSTGHAEAIRLNVGLGFEPGVAVQNDEGLMIYAGPFGIEQHPTDDKILLFHCRRAMFVAPWDEGDPSEHEVDP